uniref:Protein MAIN-LIKE 2-like n=1 Tax=Cicer arietinum TaxID=3827 RepID=A0A1S2Z2F5_CICAR|nr:protein MAIN-LIKE 2-like [Cicer arietinum]
MARGIWEGDDRGSLKVINCGLKLKKFAEVPMPNVVQHWILFLAYLTMADVGLISAFVERWHIETNSFVFLFGQMTIPLNDVVTLYLSAHCKFFDAHMNMNTNNTARDAHEFLGATWEETCAEITYNKCVQYLLQWLCDLYNRLIQSNMFECAARMYLLHLVGSTILADKTHTRVEGKYVSLFIDLDRCQDYSWGTASLVVLYDNMRYGTIHDSRQLGGYMTLLQHFPRISKRGDRGAVPAHLPRACRWNAKYAVEGGLMTYRRRLDALLLEDVVFTPYDNDRANHPFALTSMFSRYLRCGGVSVPYQLERCLQKFGRIQCIPCDIPRAPNNIDWEWQTTMRASVAAFWSLYPIATFLREVIADYYAWYLNVSHPLIFPPPTAIAPSIPPTVAHDPHILHLF